MLVLSRHQEHRRMPWRNGGGVTFEVACLPADATLSDFDWRISIAEVEAGGPFSAFADVDRTIVLIDGEWMALTVDGERHRFGVREPFRFDGGSETTCEVAGPSRDLNVMTRRGRATASLEMLGAGTVFRAPGDAGVRVLVCVAPSVVLEDADGTRVELDALDAALCTDGAPVTIGGQGTVAAIQIRSVVQ